jgi:hypothetical protein
VFVGWTEKLFRFAKRLLKRDAELDAYVGEEARRWRREGGVFIELAIKDHPPIIAGNSDS